MKFYLSSYKIGDEGQKLKKLLPPDKRKIGYIPNALDFTNVDLERRKKNIDEGIRSLQELDYEVEILDLRDYFGKQDELEKKLNALNGVFVSGGNTFILRQAMHLSGFDVVFKKFLDRNDFLYSGFSAGICVLAPDMRSLQIVDDPEDNPYGIETIWEGLGFLDYMILPHYDSDHPESADIDKEIAFCKENNISFKPLRDGEVIIIE